MMIGKTIKFKYSKNVILVGVVVDKIIVKQYGKDISITAYLVEASIGVVAKEIFIVDPKKVIYIHQPKTLTGV